ncbi:MAG: NAD(P)/FAD-dependent oxidoreductase [Phenylobacterium sp.]
MSENESPSPARRIVVIGAGAAGLSAAWRLGEIAQVTVLEADGRLGGHANTLDAPGPRGDTPVDTGFIVYNEDNYPNFTALLSYFGVASQPADMGLSVSLDAGALEYSSNALLAQKRNLLRPRFWRMISDILRFYRRAPDDLRRLEGSGTSLDVYLAQGRYGRAFRDDHLLPMAAAIWSTPLDRIGDYPAASLIRFFLNHGMMTVTGRGLWRTVTGGSRSYVRRLTAATRADFRTGVRVEGLTRSADGVRVRLADGAILDFDEAVLAVHGDSALALLEDPAPEEAALLGAFRYARNRVMLHRDPALMPRRRAAWTAWNHIGFSDRPGEGPVTYWMTYLQSLKDAGDLFVTLNPPDGFTPRDLVAEIPYEHPLYDAAAMEAQTRLWSLQGVRRTWFCGSYFGHGFHEDALQSGLAAAEDMGAPRRPWTVAGESSRIHLPHGAGG